MSFGKLMEGRKLEDIRELVDVTDHKTRDQARKTGSPADLQMPFEEAGWGWMKEVVGRTGFEPVKAEPVDLQSTPFDRFGTYPIGGRTSYTQWRAGASLFCQKFFTRPFAC
jgi:hypothetical protein